MMKRKENSIARNVIYARHNIVMILGALISVSISNMEQDVHILRQKKERNTKMHVESDSIIALPVSISVSFAGDMYLDYANAH
jgi:hypothetical protein